MDTFVILCGGLGSRFQKVSSKLPKILVEIKPEITMLDWLVLEYLPPNSNVILATGHLKDLITNFVRKKCYKNILFSPEEKKLGTGGALINASKLISNHDFIAINGDTIQKVKIKSFLEKSRLFHEDVINVGCTTSHFEDSGKLLIDDCNYISSFTEKNSPDNLFNQNQKLCTSLGIYRCKTEFFQNLRIEPKSLENDIIPFLVKSKKARASIFHEKFFDFGTFDRYKKLMNNNILNN